MSHIWMSVDPRTASVIWFSLRTDFAEAAKSTLAPNELVRPHAAVLDPPRGYETFHGTDGM